MSKSVFALLMIGTVLLPSGALGDERIVTKSDGKGTFLPAVETSVPWLKLDPRTKLPKGDFPIGRHAEGINHLMLQPLPNVQMSFREQTAGFDARGRSSLTSHWRS